MGPIVFDFKLNDFDLSLLPVDAELVKGNESLMKSAVKEYLRGVFRELPGDVSITSHDDYISVKWVTKTYRDIDAMMDMVTGLLNQGAFSQVEPILRTLFFRYPNGNRSPARGD